MNLIQRFPLLAFTLVLISIVGLCIAQESVSLLLVAGSLAAISWYVTEGPRGKVLPRWVSSLLLIAASLNVFVQLGVNEDDRWLEVLGRFAVWMTLIKLYEQKTPRDYRLLLALSLLLMLTGAVQSASLLFGGVLLVYAVLGLYTVLAFQIYAAHEDVRLRRRRSRPSGVRLLPGVKPIVSHRVPGQFHVLAGGIGATCLLVSVVVFLIFPRGLGASSVSMPGAIGTVARTGFNDQIDLVGGTRISESRRSVLSLTLQGADGTPVRLDEPLLLRGAVLERYHGGGRWSPAGGSSVVIDTGPALVPVASEIAREQGGMVQVIEQMSRQKILFTQSLPVAVGTGGGDEILFDPATWILSRADPGLEPYTVRAIRRPDDDLVRAVSDGRRTEPELDVLLSLPGVRDLAFRLLVEAGVPQDPPPVDDAAPARGAWNLQAARVFQSYLQSAAFAYDLDLSDVVTGEQDPIRQFLFETKRGHCEYFASAMAALCHNARVPVRVVTGYLAWQYDASTQSYPVIESNAHAWVEVRDGPWRWVPIDPTPPAALRDQHATPVTLADRLSWIYQRFETSWDAGVTSYDGGAQSRLAGRFDLGWADRMAEAAQVGREWLVQINRAFYFGPAGYIWMGVVAFALVLAVIVLIRLMRRSRAVRRAAAIAHFSGREYHRLLRTLGFYVDMLVVLERHGLGKPPYRPPLEHARQLASSHPKSAALVDGLSRLFYRARFAGEAIDRATAAEARRMVDELAGLRGRA